MAAFAARARADSSRAQLAWSAHLVEDVIVNATSLIEAPLRIVSCGRPAALRGLAEARESELAGDVIYGTAAARALLAERKR